MRQSRQAGIPARCRPPPSAPPVSNDPSRILPDRAAIKGLPRQAGRILCTAMRLAVPKGLNHLPDEIVQQAIKELQ